MIDFLIDKDEEDEKVEEDDSFFDDDFFYTDFLFHMRFEVPSRTLKIFYMSINF
jgi:hypothetical protein